MTDQSSHEIRLSPEDRASHPAEASTVTQHHNKGVSEAPTVVSGGSKKNRPSQPSRDPNALVQGERLDHFELQEYIDVGGMGTVFRAWDTKLHRQVAVKVLPQEYAENRESVQRFLQEARAAALAARRHDGSSSRRRKAQAGIGERRGGGSGSTSEVHKDAMEGLRPAYPPATPERSRARPLRAPRLPTPIFPAADRCCSEPLLRADPRQCRAAGRHSGLQHFHRDPGRPSNGLRRLRPPVDGSPTRLCRPAGTPLRPCLRRVTGGFRHR